MVTDSILMRASKACTADFLTPTLSWVVRRRTIATTTLSLEPVRVREFKVARQKHVLMSCNVLLGVARRGSMIVRDWTLLLTASTTSWELLPAADARHERARPHTLKGGEKGSTFNILFCDPISMILPPFPYPCH